MTYIIGTALFITGIALWLVMRLKAAKRKEKVRIYNGLMLLQQIHRLVELIQQHRGLSIAIRQGNDKLKYKHTAVQHDIDTLLATDKSATLNNFEQWPSFAEHWPRLQLNTLNKTLDPHHLMKQHGAVIEGLFSLVDDVARVYRLQTIMLGTSIRMLDVCIDTLRTSETIAQARGVGSGICALGKSEGTDEIKLNFLKSSIATSTSDLFDELKTIQNPDINIFLGGILVGIKNNSDKLVALIDDKILTQKNIEVSAQAYFEIATIPIDELSTLFTQLISYITKKHALEY